MKKKLGALVLVALSSLALSAACASSGSTTEPKEPKQQEENWVEARPLALPAQPADAAAETDVQMEAAR